MVKDVLLRIFFLQRWTKKVSDLGLMMFIFKSGSNVYVDIVMITLLCRVNECRKSYYVMQISNMILFITERVQKTKIKHVSKNKTKGNKRVHTALIHTLGEAQGSRNRRDGTVAETATGTELRKARKSSWKPVACTRQGTEHKRDFRVNRMEVGIEPARYRRDTMRNK